MYLYCLLTKYLVFNLSRGIKKLILLDFLVSYLCLNRFFGWYQNDRTI